MNIAGSLSTAAAEVPYDRAMDSLIEPSSLNGLQPDRISISNINLSLGSGAARVHILKDVSLRVAPGEAIGLIGPSGSGKSTLLMVMAGLERPDSGQVVVNGTLFNDLDEDALDHDLLLNKEIQSMFSDLMIAKEKRYRFLSNKRSFTKSELDRQSLLIN